jgi:hypothetical protein
VLLITVAIKKTPPPLFSQAHILIEMLPLVVNELNVSNHIFKLHSLMSILQILLMIYPPLLNIPINAFIQSDNKSMGLPFKLKTEIRKQLFL